MSSQIQAALELIKAAQSSPLPDDIAKAWTQSGSPTSGLTAYDLEAPAKKLYPVITPLRNTTPRVGGGTGTAVNWRNITGINVNQLEIGVSEGNRGGIIATSTSDSTVAYKGLGLEDYVSFEADYAAQGFDDVKARAVEGLLTSLMIGEEKIILGGNQTLALGTTPTPSLAASTTGGSLATGTLSVIAVALTLNGVLTGSVAGGIRANVSRTNADGSSDSYGGGAARKSTNATVSVTGPTGSVAATVAAVNGALGYAWFWGAAGSEVLGAITSLNSAVITANAAGTQTAASLPAADWSQNSLVFDGYLTQIFKPGSNSTIIVQPTGTAGIGTPLTSDSAGGIVEFDSVLRSMWDNYRLSPSVIWVNSQEQGNIHKKILSAPNNAAQRFSIQVSDNKIRGGTMAVSYMNKFGVMAGDGDGDAAGQEIPIRIHPNLPAGTVFFQTKELPYKLSNVANVARIKTRKEYYQLEWPLRSRKYEYGVYADEVLQVYFTPAYGLITNIGNG
jgi:hypothetical protein